MRLPNAEVNAQNVLGPLSVRQVSLSLVKCTAVDELGKVWLDCCSVLCIDRVARGEAAIQAHRGCGCRASS